MSIGRRRVTRPSRCRDPSSATWWLHDDAVPVAELVTTRGIRRPLRCSGAARGVAGVAGTGDTGGTGGSTLAADAAPVAGAGQPPNCATHCRSCAFSAPTAASRARARPLARREDDHTSDQSEEDQESGHACRRRGRLAGGGGRDEDRDHRPMVGGPPLTLGVPGARGARQMWSCRPLHQPARVATNATDRPPSAAARHTFASRRPHTSANPRTRADHTSSSSPTDRSSAQSWVRVTRRAPGRRTLTHLAQRRLEGLPELQAVDRDRAVERGVRPFQRCRSGPDEFDCARLDPRRLRRRASASITADGSTPTTCPLARGGRRAAPARPPARLPMATIE